MYVRQVNILGEFFVGIVRDFSSILGEIFVGNVRVISLFAETVARVCAVNPQAPVQVKSVSQKRPVNRREAYSLWELVIHI